MNVQPHWQQTGSFDPSFPTNAQVGQTPVRVKTEGDLQNFNRGGGVQGNTQGDNETNSSLGPIGSKRGYLLIHQKQHGKPSI